MNAAARSVHQSQSALSTRHVVITHLLSLRQTILLLLSLTVLLSALSIIYVTNVTRVLYGAYQHNLVEQDRMHAMQSQLLLERSAWMTPARVSKIAENKLEMVLPDSKAVVIIHE